MTDEQENQGFKVRDRRIFSPDRQEAPAEQEASPEQEAPSREGSTETGARRPETRDNSAGATARDIPLPEPSFSAFLTFFFFQQTLTFLGEIPHPETKQADKNLPMAKYLIDTLGIIQEKTRGNLNSEEEDQLDTFLTELRMRYVKAAGT